VLHKLAEALELPKLTFQVIRRSIATLAQKKGTVKDVQGVMRHSRTSTTTDVYMQEIPESVQATINSINKELRQRRPKEKRRATSAPPSKKLVVGSSQRVRGAVSNEGIPVLTPIDTKLEEGRL
jgi:integrase